MTSNQLKPLVVDAAGNPLAPEVGPNAAVLEAVIKIEIEMAAHSNKSQMAVLPPRLIKPDWTIYTNSIVYIYKVFGLSLRIG